MSGIIAAAGIGAAASIGGGLLASSGSSGAGAQSAQAGREANLFAQNQRNVNQSNASPWISTGRNAAGTIGGLLGYGYLRGDGQEGGGYSYDSNPEAYNTALYQLRQYANASGATQPTYNEFKFNPLTTVSESFTADPSYNWRVSEGNKALDRSASSKGMSLSGAQSKALTDYNSNVASQEYGNWYDRWMTQNDYNSRYGLAANAQNFGQQQQVYQNQYGQWRDALGDVYKASGQGAQVAGNLASVDSSLTNSANNALVSSANNSAAYTSKAADSTANAVSGAADAATTALGYYLPGWGNSSSGITRTSSKQTYDGY